MRIFPLSSDTDLNMRPNTRDSAYEWRTFNQRVDLNGFKIDQIVAANVGVFKLQFNDRPATHWDQLMFIYHDTNCWSDPMLYFSAKLDRWFVVKGASVPELKNRGINRYLMSFAVTLEEQPHVNYPEIQYVPSDPTLFHTSGRANLFGIDWEQVVNPGTPPIFISEAIWKSGHIGDFAIFNYVGYGFQLYAPKMAGGGRMEVTVDGTVVLGPESNPWFDLGGNEDSTVIYNGITKTAHSALKRHQIILTNVSLSEGQEIYVDAIEVVYVGRNPV